jgi:hypothetical protein
MEIDITSLLEMDCFALSHSRAEGGQNAGAETWNASKEQARETPLLDTPEKLDAMRDFASDSGGWTREEIDTWDAQELNALFLQWIAGDVREHGADSLNNLDWGNVEEQRKQGHGPLNLYRGDDGRVYFYLGN